MKATKRITAILLAVLMLVTAAVCGGAAAFAQEIPTITMETSDVDRQLTLIYSQLSAMKQNDDQNTWYYTVADLDHNGNLEFIAASQHPQDRSTNLKVWEVSTDRTTLTALALNKDEDESFPDILTDCADTFHNTQTDTWYYLLFDNVVISDSDVYSIKTSVNLKNGVIGYDAYAVEHVKMEYGTRNVTHTDANGISISPELYNAAGVNAFAGTERSSTNFEWLTAAEVGTLTRLIDSYAVFVGGKAPTETFPVPKPSVLQQSASPAPTSAPAPTPAPAPQQVYLTITKNPTNENKTEGDTALFVSCANAYESLSWTIVSPNGGEYSVQNAAFMWPGVSITGEYSTTLSIANVSKDLNGWGAYCTFYYRGQTARTSTAYMYVSAKPAPRPAPSGSYSATVTDWNYSSVSLLVEGKVPVTLSWDICDVDGDVYVGAPATVSWNGTSVTYCYIMGNTPIVGPIYGTMSGTAYRDSAYSIYVVLQNGSGVHLSADIVNIIGEGDIDGASCVVYYQNYPGEEMIYQVDIYAVPMVGPITGSMGGTLYRDSAYWVRIVLDDGTSVSVSGSLVNIVSGDKIDGAPCVVYYYSYPNSDNIYQVDVYGFDSYDMGGWAGSNYYDDDLLYPDDFGDIFYPDVFDFDDQGGWAGSNYYG